LDGFNCKLNRKGTSYRRKGMTRLNGS